MNEILKRCSKCKHYYRTMATENGYNPAPYCHKYEDTGEPSSILTGKCFCKRNNKKSEK